MAKLHVCPYKFRDYTLRFYLTAFITYVSQLPSFLTLYKTLLKSTFMEDMAPPPEDCSSKTICQFVSEDVCNGNTYLIKKLLYK